jgi:hypothetical protein
MCAIKKIERIFAEKRHMLGRVTTNGRQTLIADMVTFYEDNMFPSLLRPLTIHWCTQKEVELSAAIA